MCSLLTRKRRPDAVHWRGRRRLASLDALAWPTAWAAIIVLSPYRLGLVGAAALVLVMLSAVCRSRRAMWRNHRYRFSTVKWGRRLLWAVLISAVLKWSLLHGIHSLSQDLAWHRKPADPDSSARLPSIAKPPHVPPGSPGKETAAAQHACR